MDPSVAMLISIALILTLIRLRVNVSFSILAGAILLGVLTIGTRTVDLIIKSVTSRETIRILVIVLSAFTLGYSMQELGLLKRLCNAFSKALGKISMAILPAVIGFLPMPGGALVSAIMLTDLVKKYEVGPEEVTYVNYWFRHLWVPIWPLFPSFIIGAMIVEVSYLKLISACYPVTIGMIAAGSVFLKDYIASARVRVGREFFKDFVASLYPILAVVIMSLAIGVDLAISIPVSLAILYAHKRPKLERVKKILRRTLDPKIALLIFAVMIYKNLIAYTHAAQVFFNHLRELRVPVPIASFLLSFMVGFSVGIEISYSAIALPLLTAFTGVGSGFVPRNMMLVFGGGLLGVMMSPLHLCLILTSEYYSADLSRVYRRLIVSGAILAIVVWLAYLI